MDNKLAHSACDPILAAALIAFGSVFIPPFEDGNGRIHRFLIHHVLAEKGFAPHRDRGGARDVPKDFETDPSSAAKNSRVSEHGVANVAKR